MPTTYTPSTSGALTLAYEQVSDGDKRKAASINPGLSTLADDVAKLAVGKITAATPQRSYNHFEYQIDPATQAIHWVRNHGSTPITLGWRQVRTSTGDVNNDTAIYLPFDPPHGATISAIAFWIDVPVGPHGSLPTLPHFVLSKIALGTGIATTITSATDGSASVVAYETVHSIAALGLSEVVDRTAYVYQFTFFGESGGAALDDLTVFGAEITYSTSTYDQGAG